MTLRNALAALSALFLIGTAACDEGTPVAPDGTQLRVSVYPTRITKTGTAEVTIGAYRSNGNPVNPGTEIRLSANLGIVDAVVYTDTDGIAKGTLRGDGRVGTATISAYSGVIAPVTIDIAVGQLAASMSLQLTPSSLPETGGTIAILALVRDDQSQPLPDALVNFRTEVGTLASGGKFVTTNANGEARDTLTVTGADLQLQGDDSFEVTAEVGGVGGAIITRDFTVGIQRPPEASFTFATAGLTASFTDTSTGGPTSWRWSFGDSTPESTQRNPVHTFAAPGTYFVTLTIRNSIGEDSVTNLIQINQ